MSLADEARASVTRKGGRCETGLLLDRLGEPDRSELLEALTDETVEGSALSRALKGRGVYISQYSLQRHRRGACRCL